MLNDAEALSAALDANSELTKRIDVLTQERSDLIDANKAISAKCDELRGILRWQPVASVPRDGTRVIVTHITPGGSVGFVTEARWTGSSLTHSVALDPATHWLPMPLSIVWRLDEEGAAK